MFSDCTFLDNSRGFAFGSTPWLKEKQLENPLVIINNILIDGTTCEGDAIVPDGVKNIGVAAFLECDSLISVIIPDSVVSIGDGAFNDCNSLKSVTILNPECQITDYYYAINNGYDENYIKYFDGTIYGYENSTAQAYAEECNYNFEVIDTSTTNPTEPTKPTEPTITLGNINGDSSIDSSDATLILSDYAELAVGKESSFTAEQAKAADVNGDGKFDSIDASLILAYYSHIQTGGTGTIEEFIKS